ncbi:C40 family peptidase [Cohnella sp. LGH]|uniref:C40 family peptidase n=1 Tax=Cohnella sp. LGH TaxID=1619153 RepID=UPI001FFDFCE7|nr:C40 family peptidase [Cohnella sp. LGH]
MKTGYKSMVLLSLLLTVGCATSPMKLKSDQAPVKIQSNQSPATLEEGRHIVPVRQLQNAAYVSLGAIGQATGYRAQWLPDGSYGMGDNDAVWVFRTGESAVSIAGRSSSMPAPALKEGNEMFVPVNALQRLIGDVTVFHTQENEVAFFPKPTPGETGANGQNAEFAEKPSSQSGMKAAANEESSASTLLTFAKKFMGVPYEFGTTTYAQSKSFDCSSFTQYVFDRFGIDLPRVARAQAEQGKFVSRDELRAGDLLFFYVPGRFKSNETVGHVGIYMGNGNMIHASPKPEDGVQITPIDKEYWKDTYLYAKRYS